MICDSIILNKHTYIHLLTVLQLFRIMESLQLLQLIYYLIDVNLMALLCRGVTWLKQHTFYKENIEFGINIAQYLLNQKVLRVIGINTI